MKWPLRLMVLAVVLGMSASDLHAQADLAERWQAKEAQLMTPWADDVSPGNALPEYPRPIMQRDAWHNLNGVWGYAITPRDAGQPVRFDDPILVPFAVESALSGAMERVGPGNVLWYRRTFEVPADWDGQRVLMHFGAVDWEATVYVNGQEMGTHQGGYDEFSYDVTDALRGGGEQEVVVRVWDPTDEGDQARGKQVNRPHAIWYTPVTGIWQTVWLEPVPQARIDDLRLTPDIDTGVLQVEVEGSEAADDLTVEAVAMVDGREVGRAQGPVGEAIDVPVPEARLWTPDDPHLYDLNVRLKRGNAVVDEVESYFGMRKIEVGEGPDGATRILLNGEFVFHVGPLDQGYWPDGLYTAPTDEALRFDVEQTKELGFNTTRKHVKIEPERWYYWTDKIGLLVWQDMPNADNESEQGKRQFELELAEMVDQFYNYPSIIAWVVFNEGWGQYDAARVTREVERQDPSRIVVDVSGWQHQGAGDVIDVHRYQGPAAVLPQDGKASIVGEFGGLGHVVEGHSWAGEGWGYEGTFETPEALADRYELLWGRMWRLEDAAQMSGGIYTQLTDLEIEVNGLFTYDRKVLKFDADRIRAANLGHTPYVWPDDGRFVDEATVAIMNGAESTIRYTTDGSEPTARSRTYREPFTLTESATVKARAFEGGEAVSPITTVAFEQVPGREPVAGVSRSELAQGLTYRYFEDAALQNHPYAHHWVLRRHLARGDVVAPKKSGVVETFDLSPKERDRLFNFEYEGYLDVPRDGDYTFYVHADDGVKLLVDGEQVSNRAGQSPATSIDRFHVSLQEGLHPIELRFFQAYGPSHLEVYWEGPGIEKQRIPAEALLHRGQ